MEACFVDNWRSRDHIPWEDRQSFYAQRSWHFPDAYGFSAHGSQVSLL